MALSDPIAAASLPSTSDHSPGGWLHSRLFVPLVLLGLTLAMFARVLFLPGDQVLSKLGWDGSNFFLYWRQFGFGQLRAGNFALWNPHVFSGSPFFGGFQAALLYPPNWVLYLTLPLAKAINYEFASSVFLLGLFMAMWVQRYNLHPLAVLLAACGVMFSRPFFGTILYGDLAPMDAMAWAPLILLSVDALLDQPCAKWVMVGIFALSMQVLAGYPQLVFNTIVTCAIYAGIRLIKAPRPLASLIAFAVVGGGAVLICAVQLWPGLQTAAESRRQGGTSLAFASGFSLSYDNLLTLLVPDFSGDFLRFPCWAGGAWSATLFFGLTGLTTAILGMRVKSPRRGPWIIMAVVLLFIALGRHTPLLGLLYRVVPGFNLFRRPASFTFEWVLFMAMLSAFGMDALIGSAGGARIAAMCVLIAGLALGAFGVAARSGASVTFNAIWNDLVQAVAAFSQPLLPQSYFLNPGFVAAAERFAGLQCVIGAGACLVLAALLFLRTAGPGAAYILAVFGVAEVFFMARVMVTTFPLAATVPAQVQQFVAAHPGDYRILNPATGEFLPLPIADSAIAVGANDIYGYDPVMSRRYAEFMAYSAGADAVEAQTIGRFRKARMYRLLRLRYIFSPAGNGVFECSGDLPHLLLVDGWRRIEHRDDILAALGAPSFDPGKTVILERDPEPAPAPGVEGAARLLSTTTDSLTIAADVTRPALLLVTDSYSRYWRAVALMGSSQSEYQVMSADYTLMAMPLGAGHHLFRLEYAPSGWVIGRWVSLASLLVYIAALTYCLRRRS